MALFGGNDELQTETARLGSLSLAQLGEEVLRRVWGPGGAAEDDPPTMMDIMRGLDPTGGGKLGRVGEEREALYEVIQEGVQVLVQGGLVMWEHRAGDSSWVKYKLTRRGRGALADGSAAQRLTTAPYA